MFLLPYEPDSILVAATPDDVFISIKFPSGDFKSSMVMADALTEWVKNFCKIQGIEVEQLKGHKSHE